MIDRPGPACIEFSLVKRDPLLDEPFRAPGEITVENPSVKCYAASVPGVSGMEMRRVVIAKEHEDVDPLEGSESGHVGEPTPRM